MSLLPLIFVLYISCRDDYTVKTFEGHTEAVLAVACSTNTEVIVSGSWYVLFHSIPFHSILFLSIICYTSSQHFHFYDMICIKIFLRVVGFIQLRAICAEYQHLYFYSGVMRLALSRAKAVDPEGIHSLEIIHPSAIHLSINLSIFLSIYISYSINT